MAIVVNLHNGRPLDQFSKHIRPEEDFVSWYCTEKTGITNAEISKATELESVLEQFKAWTEVLDKKKKIKLNQNCFFISWSSGGEMESDIKEETKRKKLTFPELFKAKKISLKNDFLLHAQMPLETKMKFTEAMSYLAMKYKGRPANYQDMALNTARLAVRMAKLGVTFSLESSSESAE